MRLRLLWIWAASWAVLPAAYGQDDVCPPVAPGSATIRCEIPIPEDTLLYIENRGTTRLFVTLNGHAFKLASDPAEVARSGNAFPFPLDGDITIHIGAYMTPGPNVIEFTAQGPNGSTIPRIILANVLLEGQEVAYAIEGLEPFPPGLELLPGAPNPFVSSTTLTYTIPEGRITGVPLHLAIYDLRGRLVRVLDEGIRYPGRFTAMWDGSAAGGARAASGVYLVRLLAEGEALGTRVTLVR